MSHPIPPFHLEHLSDTSQVDAVQKGWMYNCIVDLKFCLASEASLFSNPVAQSAKRCAGSGQTEVNLLIYCGGV